MSNGWWSRGLFVCNGFRAYRFWILFCLWVSGFRVLGSAFALV